MMISHLSTVLVLGFAAAGPSAAAQYPMSSCQPVIGSQQYDLTALQGPVFITVGPETPQGFKYVYQIQLCSDIEKPMIQQCSGSSVCQYMNSGNEYLYLASVSSWSKRPYPVWSFINPSDVSEGIVLTSENGDMCGTSGFRRQMNFFFNCSTTRPTSIQVLGDAIPNCPAPGLSCCYNFQITTNLACPPNKVNSGGGSNNGNDNPPGTGQTEPGIVNPGFRLPPQYQYPGSQGIPSSPATPEGNPGPGDQSGIGVDDPEKLSTGWWFVTLVFFTASLYVGLGCVYNMRTRNVSGMDAFPHLSFWRELPGLVRDGCSVSRSLLNRFLAMIWCRRMQYEEVS
mmetsp:Transcript_4723/g.11111  ORF Transcript_4723/g.11111 Transcript_4723/m.11111 type:complete len:340 (+) Transcript_4723:362-1381(+)